jgi:hypothetical protein
MIYRKAPARPARLLLRIVKVTSAAALAAACGGVVDSTGLVGGGLYCTPENDPSCEGTNPDAGGGFLIDSGKNNPCADGCGLVPSTYDGGDIDASEADAGESDGATGGGVVGLIVNLDAGDDDASTGVIGVLPHP